MEKKTMWIGLAIILIIALSLFIYRFNKVDVEKLSLCLKEKQAKMYGAYWCPHCQNQKKEFGQWFKNIDYIECTEKELECTAAGVTGYPTWIIHGQKYPGELSFKQLAEFSGCQLN